MCYDVVLHLPGLLGAVGLRADQVSDGRQESVFPGIQSMIHESTAISDELKNVWKKYIVCSSKDSCFVYLLLLMPTFLAFSRWKCCKGSKEPKKAREVTTSKKATSFRRGHFLCVRTKRVKLPFTKKKIEASKLGAMKWQKCSDIYGIWDEIWMN